ncbi:MAG: glycosyltransferase [Verrucomicrobiaceae bacterium]|nr:glycosyltransferase [Verrucomicrobiaceae bacterium]
MNSDTTPAASPPSRDGAEGRVKTAGKFLARGSEKFFLNGVSYGPFAPNSRGEPFPDDGQLASDLAHIRALGFNALRLYEPPSGAVLNAAAAQGLLLVVGIPWAEHVDFLSSRERREAVEHAVRDAALRLGAHPHVAALLVGNEIEKTLVRWMGPRRVRDFIERLIRIAAEAAPHTLVSYASYPSTEYLVPRNAPFLAMNVYLEERAAWERYLHRLQNLAGGRPLVITESGIDTRSHGEAAQAAVMRWQRESLLQCGAAGGVWFSYTDDWQRGGRRVEDWRFGLVDRERTPRAACAEAAALPRAFQSSTATPPRISVIVCTRNGAATLRACLAALEKQRHVNHEVLVIDDGSTDATAGIAGEFTAFRYIRQDHTGLSAARNHGAREAAGEVLAFTDDDCVPDDEWLLRLSAAYDDPKWVAAGGPNVPPPPRNRTEVAVADAPGAPTHVLLSDEEAEHLPGCNLSVRKDALLRIGGFREEFTTAGDDVDICWRLRAAGGKLRFVPAAMVWHHRRATVCAYLRQQRGYGAAEALLMKHHPSRFGPLGGARWRGAIYGDGLGLREPSAGSVYHGPFGFAPFQAIYPQGIVAWWDLFAGLLWLALAALALVLRIPSLACALLAGSIWAAWMRGRRGLSAGTSRDVTVRMLLGCLCWLQPVVREWARLRGMIRLHARPSWHPSLPEIIIPRRPRKFSRRVASTAFWSETGSGREALLDSLRALLREKKTAFREDDGWHEFDIEMLPGAIITWAFISVSEYHGDGRQLIRMAVLQRINKRGVLWLFAALAMLYILVARASVHFGFHGEAMFSTLVIFLIVALHVFARVNAVNLVQQAAERIRLTRLERQ